MIATLITIALAFYWLLRETDYLRIRLPMGKELPHYNVGRTMAQWDEYNKAHAKELELEQKEHAERQAQRDAHTCPVCKTFDETYLIEARVIKAGNSTVTTRACPNCLAKLEKDVINSQKNTNRKPSVKVAPFQSNFIEQVRTGSHNEYVKWNHETNEYETLSKYKVGYHHQIVNEYKTVYHDSLAPKEWLQEHEHDLDDYEPTIELSIDGKSLSVNGNYKHGMIKDFMSQYTEQVRTGKKTMTISKGEQVVNCDGGVYVAVPSDKVDAFLS